MEWVGVKLERVELGDGGEMWLYVKGHVEPALMKKLAVEYLLKEDFGEHSDSELYEEQKQAYEYVEPRHTYFRRIPHSPKHKDEYGDCLMCAYGGAMPVTVYEWM